MLVPVGPLSGSDEQQTLPCRSDVESRERPFVISWRHLLRVLHADGPADDPESAVRVRQFVQRASQGCSGVRATGPGVPEPVSRHRRSGHWRSGEHFVLLGSDAGRRTPRSSRPQCQCPAAFVHFSFPMMLSAIDPVQEAKLVGLPQDDRRGTLSAGGGGVAAAVERVIRIPGHRVLTYLPRRIPHCDRAATRYSRACNARSWQLANGATVETFLSGSGVGLS